jgi:hypothetical protein
MKTDYRGETMNYLTKTGQGDKIEYIVPKTTTELRAEKVEKDKLLDYLKGNMTQLQLSYGNLRRDVDQLMKTPGR